MKILIICQYFHPDITAAAFRMSEMAQLLANSGHEVRIITAVPHKAAAAGSEEETPPLPETMITRCHLSPMVGGGLARYMHHYLSFTWRSMVAVWRLSRTGWRPDVIWASSPPLFTAISGHFSSRLLRRPWILDVRDLWPDSAVAAGQLRASGPAFCVGKKMERFFYNHTDHLTCVSTLMSHYLGGMTATPVAVVYNGVKSDAPVDCSAAAKRGDGKSRVLLYAGNLGRLQGLDRLIDAVADLEGVGEMDGWEVRLVGAGAVRDELVASIERLGLEARIKILPPVSRSDMSRLFLSADALFLSLKPDPALRMTIPSKLFDYLATNLPIAAGLAGEGAEIAGRSGGNVIYAPEDPAGPRHALQNLFLNFEALSARARDNSLIVQTSFTREKAVSRLLEVIQKVKEKTQ